MIKTVKGIQFEAGTMFDIITKDATYKAYVITLDANTMVYKTTNPIYQGVPCVTGYRMVEFMLQDGAWKNFKKPSKKLLKPSYSAYIMYLHAERGMSSKDIAFKFPQFKKSNIEASIQDCKNYPERLAKNTIKVKMYIQKMGEPTYDFNKE